MKNKKGSILQIVLIIFTLLLSFITNYGMFIYSKTYIYKDTQKINQQRQLEVLIIEFIKEEYKESILISDSIEINETTIEYDVVDDFTYELINVHILNCNYDYSFSYKMMYEDGRIIDFLYK